GHSYGARGLLRILQGRPEEAAELMAAAAEQSQGADVYRAALAWAYAEAGRLEEAAAEVAGIRGNGFAELRHDFAWLCTLSAVGRACARLNDSQAAAELYALLVPYRESCVIVQTGWLGPVAHELGVLAATFGDDAAADAHFAAAEAMQVRIGARATLIHTRLEWGRSLLRRRPADLGRAIPLLDAALADARDLGLTALEPRIAALRAEAG
ncbi:MAG: hypothetical protein LC792_03590, partial [Actinobacteria bacterium]|nr:hypothetical protein [Actinomycetota bacterium]